MKTNKNLKEKKTEKNIRKKTAVFKTVNKKQSEFVVILYQNQQYKVSIGDRVFFPLIADAIKDQKIIFDKVILTNTEVGKPFIKNLFVEGKVLDPLKKDKKIIVFKYKSKKNYRVKTGHRAKLTFIEIKAIKKTTLNKK